MTDSEFRRLSGMTEQVTYNKRKPFRTFRLRTTIDVKQKLEKKRKSELYWAWFYSQKDIKPTDFMINYYRKEKENKFHKRFIIGSKERIIKRNKKIYEELMAVVWQFNSPMMRYELTGWKL